MIDIPLEVLRGAELIGGRVTERVMRRPWREQLDSDAQSREAVEQIAREIDTIDPHLADLPQRNPQYELEKRLTPAVARFLALHRDRAGRRVEKLPLLRVAMTPEGLGDLIPVDTANGRSATAILARARELQPGFAPDRAPYDAPSQAGAWDERVASAPFVVMRPLSEVTANFFRRFTISFWMGRRSAAKTGQSTVLLTVDCANHGYRLEYWPQFMFTPMAFGGTLTRPVTATVPISHYHFQGWLNNVVTPDNGLYPADPNNLRATLGAF